MEQLEQFILTKSENSGISAINTDVKANFPQQLRVELPAGCDASQVEVRQNYNSQTVDSDRFRPMSRNFCMRNL